MDYKLIVFVTYFLCTCYSQFDKHDTFPKVNEKLDYAFYSGKLSVGTANENYLYFWFFESQKTPSKDPVILWLDGGPGLSSLLGAIQANGPYLLKNGTMEKNSFSWNKIANVLYIESPEYVGFSNGTKDHFDDVTTAQSNWEALQSFYKLFPNYKKNKLYLSGESYAGVYIPNLAFKILSSSLPQVSLGGILLGNPRFLPVSDDKANFLTSLDFAYKSGLINSTVFQTKLNEIDCFVNNNISQCKRNNHTVNLVTFNWYLIGTKINMYNIKSTSTQGKRGKRDDQVLYQCDESKEFFQDPIVTNFLNVDHHEWNGCNEDSYKYEGSKNISNYLSMLKTLPMVVVSGKNDMMCSWLQTEYFFENYLNLTMKSNWTKMNDESNKVIGKEKIFLSNVNHKVIDNAPHSVARHNPKLMLNILRDFIAIKRK